MRLPGRPRLSILDVVAGSPLVFGLWLSARTLTRLPQIYGDEPWIGSTVWSFLHGHGLRPAIFSSSGLYAHHPTYWWSYFGTAALAVGDVVAAGSLTAYRAAAFSLGLAALAVFVIVLTRLHGRVIALAAAAVLATSWGFFAASHYARWDSAAVLLAVVLIAILAKGAPTVRTAALLGLVLAIAFFDVEATVAGVAPAVALLVGWERPQRLRRLGALVLVFAGGAVVFMAVHLLPSWSGAAREWDVIYAPHITPPIKALLTRHTLEPVGAELGRYRAMKAGVPFGIYGPAGTYWLLVAGAVAAVASFVTIRSPYPRRAIPGLLFASHVLGLAFLASIKTAQVHAWYALPYAVAAIVAVLVPLGRSPTWRRGTAVVVLATVAVVNIGLIRNDLRKTPQYVLDRKLVRSIRPLAASARIITGEAAYWYVVPRARFQTNSNIWLNRYQYGWSFDRSFHHLCADLVILDDVWLSHYAAKTPFPQVAPSDPTEKDQLLATLDREYTLAKALTAKGHEVQLWRRVGGGCGPP